jgi:hypothetical protein
LLQPLPLRLIPYRGSLYADDLILFLTPVRLDLLFFKSILQVFEKASGLACNFDKCQIVPIRCDEAQVQLVQLLLLCPIIEFPIKYLGLPLSMGKIPKVVLHVLIDQMANRLPSWKGHLMHRSGRLTLIKITLAAILVYTVMSQELPAWLLQAFTKIFKAFLWNGTEVVVSGKCLVAWSRVQRPLQLDGLSVPDLKLMVRPALRLRLLWLERVDREKPWAALPLHEDVITTAFFHSSIRCVVGDGRSTCFRLDPWLDSCSIAERAPDLFVAAHPRRRNSRTVAAALDQNTWLSDIIGALTLPVLLQYVEIRESLDTFQLRPSVHDTMI